MHMVDGSKTPGLSYRCCKWEYDLTDSFIAQLYVSTTRSDATTYIGSNHQDDGSVSVNVKSRDKIKYTA